MKKNRVILFGGTGFIGRNFSKILKKKNVPHLIINKKQINLEKSNSIKKIKKIIRRNDVIFFSSSVAPCKNIKMYEKNNKITRNFTNFLKKYNNISQLINISSDAVFADTRKLINENSCKAPDNLHGLMHLQRELFFKNVLDKNKLCIIRPTLVYGADDPHNGYGPNQFSRLAKNKKDIKLFGKGEERRDHIFIDDLIRIIYFAYKNKITEDLNAVTGKVISFNKIAQFFAKKNHVKVLFSKRIGKMPHNGFRAFDNNKILKLFKNFKFTKMKQGLKTLC